jgi:hypothetical protein
MRILYLGLNGIFFIFFLVFQEVLYGLSLDLSEPITIEIGKKRTAEEFVSSLLGNYKRGVTLLEIVGDKSHPYIPALVKETHNITGVLLYKNNKNSCYNSSVLRYNPHLIVLAPLSLGNYDFEILGRCEHFDVVVVRDFLAFGDASLEYMIELGDIVCIEVPLGEELFLSGLENFLKYRFNYGNKTVYLFNKPKFGLDIARWDLHDKMQKVEVPRYAINSNLHCKQLIKNGKVTRWHQGINLITFIELRGTYPSDTIICSNLIKQKHTEHNDLVIGNLIVQGHTLVPIDFNDKRRNIKVSRCLKAALRTFGGNRLSLVPDVCLQQYKEKL